MSSPPQYQSVRAIKQNTKLTNIVEARNYHSHLLPRKGQPLVSIEELYDLTDELRKVLICCILSYLQFPNIEIDALTHNSYNDLFQEWWWSYYLAKNPSNRHIKRANHWISISWLFFWCLGRESNPHGRFGPRDFKSLVSTIPPPRRGRGVQR